MRALQLAQSVPWAIRPEALKFILELAAREHTPDFLAAAERLEQRRREIETTAVAVTPGSKLEGARSVIMRGSTAILPVEGPISRYANLFSAVSGGTSVELLAKDFQVALDSPEVASILLHVDSPGGEVSGTGELSDIIYAARDQKPIWAYVSNEGASAAYWLASAAERIIVAPTSIVGSIGVIASVPDPTRKPGDDFQFVSSQSPNKRPDPNTKVGKSQIQAVVDDLAQVFIEAVARNRDVPAQTVLDDFGQGNILVGANTVAAGLADATGSFEQTLTDMQGLRASKSEARAEESMQTVAGPIPPHKPSKIAPDDAPWDAGKQVGSASGASQLRRMHAWVDSAGDPEAKSSYKLPHHNADGTLVPRGVSAAAQRLGATDIPSGDKAGVRRHLGAHYSQMGKTPPWSDNSSSADLNSAADAAQHDHRRSRMTWQQRAVAAIFGTAGNDVQDDDVLEEHGPPVVGATVVRQAAPSAETAQLAAERQQREALQQRLDAAEAENRRIRAERISEQADAFYMSTLTDGRCVPAEQAQIVALYTQLATIDADLGPRRQADGSTTTLVAGLVAAYEARQSHNLTKEQLKVAQAHQAYETLANLQKTPAVGEGPADAGELEKLLAMTPGGRATLAARKNGGSH